MKNSRRLPEVTEITVAIKKNSYVVTATPKAGATAFVYFDQGKTQKSIDDFVTSVRSTIQNVKVQLRERSKERNVP